MKKKLIALLLGIIAIAAICPGVSNAVLERPTVRIGIVTDGPLERFPGMVRIFKEEILAITKEEFNVRFPAAKTLDGGWTVGGIKTAIDRLLRSRDVDLVLALGYVASNEICKWRNVPKPVVAPFIVDADLQGLPKKAGASGVKNLSYIDSFKRVSRDIQTFREIVPFKNVAILVDDSILQAIPGVRDRARQIADERGIGLIIVPVETSIDEVFEKLPSSTEAVLVTPLLRIEPDEFQKLVRGLIQRKLPSFSHWGRDEVQLGILASMTPASNLPHLARGVAINVLEILRGEDAGTLGTAFSTGEQLTINMETARAIDFYPSLSILTEADLLHEERKDIERVLTLEKAVQEALEANLDLATAERVVAAGEQAVAEARSPLLPQIDIGTGAVQIDEDRARLSRGLSPERSWTGSAVGTQLIYSERAWSSYTVEKHLQNSRIEARQTLELDIIEAASTAYLNVLRAKTIERIQKNNLKLTRANLERARVRVSTGIASSDEVFRWESEIANSRRAVLTAESLTMDTMQALNRILHRPLDELFVAKETNLTDPLFAMIDKLFLNLVNNPKKLQIFRDFMVEEGLDIAPELRQFDAEIAARERTHSAARRAYWLPDFSIRGDVSELFASSGEGQRDEASTGLDDTEWRVGVFASFPLFTGGQKLATDRRTREELESLRLKRDSAAERIELRIQNAINLTRASYPSIQLTRDAAEAARKNLNLIMDSYARGIKSIIDLLDAQNLVLVADQRAANAAYDFLIDLMRVERAVGKFDLFAGPDQRQAWLHKMTLYFKKMGIELRKP